MIVEERLMRSYKDGQAKFMGYLDDYVFVITALIDLFQASGEAHYFEKALKLDSILQKYYEDKKNGGYFMTANDAEKLLVREKPAYDGAVPSGNSYAILNLLKIYHFTGEKTYLKRAENAFKSFENSLKKGPTGLSEMLLALDFYHGTPKEVILVPEKGEKVLDLFLSKWRDLYLPNAILVAAKNSNEFEKLKKLMPPIKDKYAMEDKSTAYVCENHACKMPTKDPETFKKQLQE